MSLVDIDTVEANLAREFEQFREERALHMENPPYPELFRFESRYHDSLGMLLAELVYLLRVKELRFPFGLGVTHYLAGSKYFGRGWSFPKSGIGHELQELKPYQLQYILDLLSHLKNDRRITNDLGDNIDEAIETMHELMRDCP